MHRAGAMLGIAALVAAAAAEAGDRQFRLFAVAYRHHVDRVVSYQTYRDSVRAQFLAAVAPNLAAGRPNLVTYPENQTLMAYVLGSRGASARQTLASGQPQSSSAALASLAAPYQPQIDYYNAKFPGIDSPGQLLQLALTDTLARVVIEVFGPLADEFDVYVAISGNLAPFERVEGPSAATLRDPEAGTTYAYEATAPEVYNRNFIFGPDGRLLTIQDKAYLVPVERTRDVGLGLTGIEVHALPVFELPFARVGTVISKDAWMPDVNDRYDQLAADLLIQSEAFSTWGVAGNDLWPPDKFQRGGWWMVQKHPAIHVNVTPMLTGNFGDLTFDGQPLVAVKAPAGRDTCLLGQRAEPGWAAVGRWAHYADPATAFCDPARRDEFRVVGEKLAPGSGDPLENAYAEDVVFADVVLPPRADGGASPARSRFSDSVALGGDAPQLQPALARAPDGAWLAWVDARRGRNQSVFVARTADGGTWSAAAAVDPQPVTDYDHFDNQWSPALFTDGAGALVSYLGFPTENWDLFGAHVDADGTPGAVVRIDDADTAAGVERERGHSSPVLLRLADGTVLAAWSDLRWPWVKPQIRVARASDGGATWSGSVRADGGAVVAEDAQHDERDANETRGQAFPAVALAPDGALLVAWQELSAAGVPSVYVSRSLDGGRRFGAPRVVTGSASAWRPALLEAGGTVWLAYEEETAPGGRRIALRQSGDGGETFSAARALDPSAPDGGTQRYVRLLPYGNGGLAVFEDRRAGDGDILAVSFVASGSDEVGRVDDGPAGAEARAPAATLLPDGRVVVAWQDTRDGVEKVRVAVEARAVGSGGGGAWSLLAAALLLAAARLGINRVRVD
jgi:predicted amidohydrolase